MPWQCPFSQEGVEEGVETGVEELGVDEVDEGLEPPGLLELPVPDGPAGLEGLEG